MLLAEAGLLIGPDCARIGGIFKQDPNEFLNLLSVAFDAGINFYDTADIYSQGESERLLGRVFRDRRDRVVIASKAGFLLPAQRKLLARLKPFSNRSAMGWKLRQIPSGKSAVPTDTSLSSRELQNLDNFADKLDYRLVGSVSLSSGFLRRIPFDEHGSVDLK